MVINFSSLTLPQSETLKLHILVERNTEGNVIASVLEFPNTQVEASTQEQAVEELKQLLSTRLEKIEIIPVEIELPQSESENPWMKFAGVFKDDADFAEIADNLRAERNIIDED
jgi:predicted RNase H-like HicB family nuclease